MKYLHDEKTELELKEIHSSILRRRDELTEAVRKEIESGAIQDFTLDTYRATKLIEEDSIIKYLKERMIKVAQLATGSRVEL
jgi:hypothetical protein